jgi:hypothetical protein
MEYPQNGLHGQRERRLSYHDNRPSFYNAIPILHLDPGHFNIRDQRFIGAHSGAAMTRGGKALAIEA